MKKILLIILLIIPINVFALCDNAKSCILIDYDTGYILAEKNKDERLAMASMTKMMTLLLAMERIEDGSIKLDDVVTVSKKASSMGGSQIYLVENEKVTVDVLLKAISVASANDAAYALSEYIGGNESEFVKLMNEKKKELNLLNTNFTNVHGLDEKDHYSSSYDMALLAKELIKHDLILKYSSIYEDYIEHNNGKSTWIVNTNKMLNNYKGLDGLKTGYTINSKYCITSTAKRNNFRLISVVMGSDTSELRNQDTIELLNYGFSNYKIETILNKNKKLNNIDVLFGKKESIGTTIKDNVVDLIKYNDNHDYTYEINELKLKAPINKNDKVGSIIIYKDNKKLKTYDILASESVKKANFFELFYKNFKKILKGYI